jgi:predicted lactoylglutathione lyase
LSSKNRSKEILDEVSSYFKKQGYDVNEDLLVKDEKKVDLVASNPEEVVLIEIKPFKIDTSDLMHLESLAEAISSNSKFENKEIKKIIVSPSGGTIPVESISERFNIKIIKSGRPNTVKNSVDTWRKSS